MKNRLQMLLMGDDGDSAPNQPNPNEALGVWVLGLMWALTCLWLGYLGSHWVVPGMLLGGLLALWGWRHVEWLWWFPTVLVVASMLEPLSPLGLRSRFGPLGYRDLLALGVVAVAVARTVGLRKPLLPRSGLLLYVAGIAAALLVLQLTPSRSAQPLVDLRDLGRGLVVFFATMTVASRPRGSRWVWASFPVVSAVFGTHAVWAVIEHPGMLEQHARLADAVWSTRHGALSALIIALPATFGLAASAGDTRARLLWMGAGTLGGVGLVLHLGATPVLETLRAWVMPLGLGDWVRIALVWVGVAIAALWAWQLRLTRASEAPRWLALIGVFISVAALETWGSALAGPALPLAVIALALVDGTRRAERRHVSREMAQLRKAA